MLSASAAAAAFFFPFDLLHYFLCHVLQFLFWRRLFYCDDNILISFLELGHFNVGVLGLFSVCSTYDDRLIRFLSSLLALSFLFWRVDQESSHNTSMVASHVDHVVCFSVFHVAQVSSLFVEGVLANTFTVRSFLRSQLCIEVSSNDRNALFVVPHVFLNSFVHLLDVVVRIFRVWEVHTHQIDVLAVDQDRGFDGTLIDVIGVNNCFSPPFVQHDSNSVFVIIFPSTHKNGIVLCLPQFGRFMSPRLIQENRVPSVTLEFGYQFFDFCT